MKYFFLSILFFAFANSSYSQCSKFYPLQAGVKMELTTYDKKGKEVAIMSSTITEVRTDGNQQIATISSSMKDKKGKQLADSGYEIRCTGNLLSIDFKSMINAAMMEQYKDMDIEVSGTNVDLPSDLKVGDKLNDAQMDLKISLAGMPMNVKTEVKDREVIAKESITTPAGTFECYVITYSTSLKMGMTRTSNGKQWISEGVGLVKQEDYASNGQVNSSTVLTAFSK
ncbi:hypothetical protein SAMN03097699_1252 [Flavobacteriaceae bacterium MAR_2010_188]|nr:hypothetical protein SAMN03097699_1252 [Flavobacteriaceae bacterium MAR_2010_188]